MIMKCFIIQLLNFFSMYFLLLVEYYIKKLEYIIQIQ